MFFDTIKIRNYWPTIITRVHAERFLERKFFEISMYLMANVDWRIPTYFRRLFSFLQEFWLQSHSWLGAAILDLPLFARRPRRIFPKSLTGDVTSEIAEDDWERGCTKLSSVPVTRLDLLLMKITMFNKLELKIWSEPSLFLLLWFRTVFHFLSKHFKKINLKAN